jgi:hypothetical protein
VKIDRLNWFEENVANADSLRLQLYIVRNAGCNSDNRAIPNIPDPLYDFDVRGHFEAIHAWHLNISQD